MNALKLVCAFASFAVCNAVYDFAHSPFLDGGVAVKSNNNAVSHLAPVSHGVSVSHSAPVVSHSSRGVAVGHSVPVVSHAAPLAVSHSVPIVSHAAHIATPVKSQYHSQDELGHYSFGYNADDSSRQESRDAYGNVRGSFSYVDSYGNVQSQHYVADHYGFRVVGTNLPHRYKRSYGTSPYPASTGPLDEEAQLDLIAHAVAPLVHAVPPLHAVAPVLHAAPAVYPGAYAHLAPVNGFPYSYTSYKPTHDY